MTGAIEFIPFYKFFNHSHRRFKSYTNTRFQRSLHLYLGIDLFIPSQCHWFYLFYSNNVVFQSCSHSLYRIARYI